MFCMTSQGINRLMNVAIKTCCLTASALSVAVIVILSGCSADNSGLDKRYSVSGRVTYKGEPVQKGTIVFEPTNPAPPAGRHASSTIEDGKYALTTSGEGADGALAGDYNVLVLSSTVDMRPLAEGGKLVHQGDAAFQKIVKEGKSLVPQKYSKSETSGLKYKVEPRSQTKDWDLTD
jgi:hypothetical protein